MGKPGPDPSEPATTVLLDHGEEPVSAQRPMTDDSTQAPPHQGRFLDIADKTSGFLVRHQLAERFEVGQVRLAQNETVGFKRALGHAPVHALTRARSSEFAGTVFTHSL